MISTLIDFSLKTTGFRKYTSLFILKKLFKQYNYDKIAINKLIFRKNDLYNFFDRIFLYFFAFDFFRNLLQVLCLNIKKTFSRNKKR